MYQWTARDERTSIRFLYRFEEYTPKNTVKFLKCRQFRLIMAQDLAKNISDERSYPFGKILSKLEIKTYLYRLVHFGMIAK